MGKAKQQLKQPRPSKHAKHEQSHKISKRQGVKRRQHSQHDPLVKSIGAASQHGLSNGGSPKTQNKTSQPAIWKAPFSKHDRVLLVGEGDFSFSLSLANNYRVKTIIATCFDSHEDLIDKYPGVKETLFRLRSNSNSTQDGHPAVHEIEDDEWAGLSSSSVDGENSSHVGSPERHIAGHPKAEVTTVFRIDATKLSSTHRKALNQYGPYHKIIFNFPHVGGLSTDVNRQVRYNQELLVGFFKAAKPLLLSPSNTINSRQSEHKSETYTTSDEEDAEEEKGSKPDRTGCILVSLFEGEPYTLWNIRDLARHSGLKVVESFKFPWSAFPDYQHARTIGDITTGKDRSDEGKRKGAWRGEERDARCYVLTLQEAETSHPAPGSKKARRAADAEDSD